MWAQTTTAEPFFTINIGHIIELGVFALTAVAFSRDQKKERKKLQEEHEEAMNEQARMHQENQQRLDNLTNFQAVQLNINLKRDEQINELKTQTATLSQIARGLDRRLEMIEDRGQSS